MKLVDLADSIYRELGSPTTPCLAEISHWLRYNIGQLNIQLHEETVLDEEEDEFSPELTIEQANIYKLMYFVKYADTNRQNNLGPASYDWSEISEGDTTIRKVSKNEVAKNYKLMRDGYTDDLRRLIHLYKNNQIVPASWTYSGREYLDFIRYATCRTCG